MELKKNTGDHKKLRDQKATWLKVCSGSRLRAVDSRWIGMLDRHAQKSRRIATLYPVAHLVRARKHNSGHSHITQSISIQD